jgi:signal transduction histidine kinase
VADDSAQIRSTEHLLQVVQALSAARDVPEIAAIIERAAPHHASELGVRLLCALGDASTIAMTNLQRIAELEARVTARTAQLEATQRELEAFSVAVSHDLRAPLRAIAGFSQAVLEDHAAALGDGRRPLDRIRAATARMTAMIDDLRRFAGMACSELERRAFDLAPLAREIVEELRAGDPARTVDVIVPAALPAHGDPRLLRAVLANLLHNAWKFTSRRDDAWIELGARDGAFFVRDNGVGFDDAHADRLFTPFHRLHAADFEGAGVGLAIAQRIVHRHGGRIWAEGAPGHGATFTFTLG